MSHINRVVNSQKNCIGKIQQKQKSNTDKYCDEQIQKIAQTYVN